MYQMAMESRFLLILIFLFCTALPLTLQQQETPVDHFCTGNFTGGNSSTFSSNLDRLSSALPSVAPSVPGFYNISMGQRRTPGDAVNFISLCGGEVLANNCRNCIINGTAELRRLCPNQKEGFIWYYSCMVRYSNRSIYGLQENAPLFRLRNPYNVTSSSFQEFNQILSNLFNQLGTRAARGGSTRKYATGSTAIGEFFTIYAMVQCTPELSEVQCSSCLSQNFGQMLSSYFNGKIGGRTMAPSCNFRYEIYKFYDSSADAQPQPPPPISAPQGKKGSSTRTILAIVVPIIAFLAISVFGCTLLLKQRKLKKKETKNIESGGVFQFKFNTIREATNDFSEQNKLGEGGFGVVYKGKLQNGQEVAVKRLSKSSNEGRKEFENEVQFMGKLQHRNLVKLLGFSMEAEERLLVYEFLPLSSLEKYISDPDKSSLLDWDKRYNIITGIARGTLYLHEDSQLRIIHRDLKASNILLDVDMNPKISDFGMAKLFPVDITQVHASSVVGTLGYMAPEYVNNGQVSIKTDVYSFGVLVLEIISGQRINNFNGEGDQECSNLLSYAWENWKKGTIHKLLDPNLRGAPESDVMKCLHLALLCVQENATNRPSMATVVLVLSSSISVSLPSSPAILLHALMPSERPPSTRYGAQVVNFAQSENENIQFSTNEASFSEITPR